MSGIAKKVVVGAVVLTALSGTAELGTSAQPESRPPNILYVFTDDQSRRSVGCYPEAHPWVKTPRIDALAGGGLRFTTCYTGTWCQPSRAGMLSGKLQHAQNTLRITNYPMATYDPEVLPFCLPYFGRMDTRLPVSANGISVKTSAMDGTGIIP